MGHYVDIRLNGRQVVQLRRAIGLTQLELAEKAGMSQAFVSKMELSTALRSSYGTANKIARALEVDLNAILVEPLEPAEPGSHVFTDALLAKCVSSAASLPPEKQEYLGRIMAPILELAKQECNTAA